MFKLRTANSGPVIAGTQDGQILVWNDLTQEWDLGTNAGAQGPQGFQGPQGVQGFQGAQGFQGFQGSQGAQGDGECLQQTRQGPTQATGDITIDYTLAQILTGAPADGVIGVDVGVLTSSAAEGLGGDLWRNGAVVTVEGGVITAVDENAAPYVDTGATVALSLVAGNLRITISAGGDTVVQKTWVCTLENVLPPV
jgi:hypothetical protein